MVKIPLNTMRFLFSPNYFLKTLNLGKILITNDSTLSEDGFSKSGRRVVVTSDNRKNIKVNKITSDKDFDPNASTASKNKQKRFTTKIDYSKYPNALTKESVVDNKQYSINQHTGNKLKITDSQLTDTGEKLSASDLRKVKRNIK